ncbi:MAG: DUF721 domain-containing protein [bacterium]|nr:DUF721 domain-containing protein [bacterium]
MKAGKQTRGSGGSEQNPELEAEIIAAVFGELGPELQEQRVLAKCQALWPELAGTLSKHSYPVRVRGDRLEVMIEKAVYRQEFQLLSREILKRVNAATGARMKRVKVDPGRIEWQSAKEFQEDPYRPQLRKDPAEFNEGQRTLLDGLEEIL